LASPVLDTSPFLETLTYLFNIFSLGILTFLKIKYPLSLVLNPNFGPISPTSIPFKGSWEFVSLIGTIKA